MKNWIVMLGAVALIAMNGAAGASEITDKNKCLGAVATVAEMKASDEVPELGEKAEAELDALTTVAAHLCETGEFIYADELLEIARGMLASE